MMAKALGTTRLDVIAHPERVLTEAESLAFESMVAGRSARCPLAYILGEKEFYGLAFKVTPGVLIPRPETEVLVAECLKRVGDGSPVIADVGTGTGAAAIALAINLPRAGVYATEISDAALEVARANIENHQLSDRVTLLKGDLIEPLAGLGLSFDAVVSNPPYVRTRDISSLQPEVRLYEPLEAPDGGEDGLDAHRRLFPAGFRILRADGFVAVEVGLGQAGEVKRIASAAGFGHTETANDLAGIERVVIGHK
jgi:release factor glutamine methyltransferase